MESAKVGFRQEMANNSGLPGFFTRPPASLRQWDSSYPRFGAYKFLTRWNR